MKKFRDMTDSEKLEILNAAIDGKRVEQLLAGGRLWATLFDLEELNLNSIYRVKKHPMSIDWSVLKDEFICAARNAEGQCAAFTIRPGLGKDRWINHRTAVDIGHLKSLIPGTVDWTESLIWRPGHGENS